MGHKSPKMFISKLVLKGRNKDYTVEFKKGLNVIYGDSDTGKSSILNIINYLLGYKKIKLYSELESNGLYALLEVYLNDKLYTIKRDIFKPSETVEIYPAKVEDIDKIFPMEFSPDYSKSGPSGFFSDFLMDSLGIPRIKVKQAPSKADSDMIRLSFRDIFKFCYMNQDDVGSEYLLDSNNWSVFVKNKETFRFIHNLLDTQISELEQEITEKEKRRTELQKKGETISSFLREVRLDTLEKLEREVESLDNILFQLGVETEKINKLMRSENQYFDDLRSTIVVLEENLRICQRELIEDKLSLEQNRQLAKEYQSDIEKLQAIIEVINKLPEDAVTNFNVLCPLCHATTDMGHLTDDFIINEESLLKNELKSLSKRHKGLESLMTEQRNKISLNEMRLTNLNVDANKARELLDTESQTYITPYIQQRDSFISKKASVLEEKKKLTYLIKVRKQQEEIYNNINIVSSQLDGLREQLTELRKTTPTSQQIRDNLANSLADFVRNVGVRNSNGISLSEKNFLPVVRNKEYSELTSGGLRTIASVGYFLSHLVNGLLNSSNLPSFVMIDTISKYLGKTQLKYLSKTDKVADMTEGVNDPTKRLNMFKYLIRLHKKYGEHHQIIVVDNDIPTELELLLREFTVKRFSVDGRSGFEKGFINDVDYKLIT
jgi:energy-coupling factor transporter ATP-binding protein EcfA2